MLIDVATELARVRAGFDGPEQYPGEAFEGVIGALAYDIGRADFTTQEARRDLRAMCTQIIGLIDVRESMS